MPPLPAAAPLSTARRRRARAVAALLLGLMLGLPSLAPLRHAGAEPAVLGEAPETLLLQEPTASAGHVVFTHAQDLWVVEAVGGEARRLTSSPGAESAPSLSPDGRWVAFTGEYEGNADVYVLPLEGGLPRRLTWHPDRDRVLGWHPDGQRVCFASPRAGGPGVDKAFLVPAAGGPVEELPLPEVAHLAFDPAQPGRVAYTPIRPAFRTWKRYRGGRVSPLWLTDLASLETTALAAEGASQAWPCLLGGWVWFASDRDTASPTGNLAEDRRMQVWRWRPGSAAPEQVTRFTNFDVRWISAGGGRLVVEQGGALHLLDPQTLGLTRLVVRIRHDGLHALPRWQEVKGHVRAMAVAPNGQRAAFEARGEILSLPRSDGDVRNLSDTPDAHERDPAWSPDGKRLAWLGDGGGEMALWVRDARGQGEARRYALPGSGFAYSPQWSPDGQHILYSDEKSRLCFLTLADGQSTEVAVLRGSLGVIAPSACWSPDSRWIAYEGRNPGTAYDQVVLYRLEDRRSVVLSDAFGSAENPVFSPDGKHLFFKATVDSGPQRFGLDMSATTARAASSSLYVAVLARDGANPLFPRSDEGDGKAPREGRKEAREGKDGKDAKDEAAPARADEEAQPGEEQAGTARAPARTVIDLEGLDQRVLALPLPPKAYGRLLAGKERLFFLEPGSEGQVLSSFGWKARKAEDVARGVDDALLSADGSTLLLQGKEGWHLQPVDGKERKRVAVEQARVRVEPVREWRQVLREAWRLQRDLFYDRGMHHVDWPAMWERWQAFLPHVRHRADLNLLLGEMLGELACGHQYVSGGELPAGPTGPGTGMLGADIEVRDGRARIARILDGQNWNPTLRAPLTEPGVDVRVGDVLRSVNGKPVQATANVLALFEATADTQVELVLERPGEATPRTVRVVPVASDRELRRRAWIEERRAICERLSGGRLAYVYMPDTGPRGIDAFQRDFFGQVDREGLVLDERYNGGGKVADWVIDILSHDVWCWWMTRTGWAGRTPFSTLQGPKVMLVNAYAGSGGDAMPWFFRQQRLGPLVGTRTWGGLVGITGYPPLMDGGSVTAAAFGIMDRDGRWIIENEGVTPDVEVLEWPKDCAGGRDPTLERAVALALEALPAHPRVHAPAYTPPSPR